MFFEVHISRSLMSELRIWEFVRWHILNRSRRFVSRINVLVNRLFCSSILIHYFPLRDSVVKKSIKETWSGWTGWSRRETPLKSGPKDANIFSTEPLSLSSYHKSDKPSKLIEDSQVHSVKPIKRRQVYDFGDSLHQIVSYHTIPSDVSVCGSRDERCESP
jgi:hypothetical protein